MDKCSKSSECYIASFKACGIYSFNPSDSTVQESESSSSKSGESSAYGNTKFCTTVSDDIEDNADEVTLTSASFSAEQEQNRSTHSGWSGLGQTSFQRSLS